MKFDTVIIGASSSGLYAAEQLAQAGLRVGVFERQKELDPARRTYIITPHLQKLMKDVPDIILHRIDTLAVETPNASVKIPLSQPDLVLERKQIIHRMAQRAKDGGAELFMGYSFRGVDQSTIQFEREGERLQVEARSIIAADGAFSCVAEAAGITQPETVPLAQAEIDLPAEWDASVTKVWFDIDETRFFYWMIPESESRGVVGLIGAEGSDVRALLDRFMDKHGFQAQAYQVGQAAMHRPGLRPWGQVGHLPVYLVGDAAGQVKVTTVGGTVTGFWGAQAVVEAILDSRPYHRTLRPLKRELNMHWLIRFLLERLDNDDYDRMVELISPAVVDFLAQRNRDEMAGAFWKLLLLQPRFVGFAARFILKK
ncbi:MAG: NAD(P)/FAD-dependent oxidoreductase [Chloroflexota bacterium]|nr:NAD(P)/FAD-dependent oxidoreductase [Chloroflexota bacterium]